MGLRLRSGLHSGPITGGILRGEKSRFQLFGDTMNIAAKMESSGIPTKVQISKDTAELLSKAEKEHWFEPRDDIEQETFWLIPDSHINDNIQRINCVRTYSRCWSKNSC